jgi:hypothetical protein
MALGLEPECGLRLIPAQNAFDVRGKTPLAIRILIADDLEVVRRGLRAVLQVRPEWEICGEAGMAVEHWSKLNN